MAALFLCSFSFVVLYELVTLQQVHRKLGRSTNRSLACVTIQRRVILNSVVSVERPSDKAVLNTVVTLDLRKNHESLDYLGDIRFSNIILLKSIK